MMLLSSAACWVSVWQPNSFIGWFAYKLNKEISNKLNTTLGVGQCNATPPEPVGGTVL